MVIGYLKLFVPDDEDEYAVVGIGGEEPVAGLAAEGGKVVGGAGIGGAHG